MTTMSLTQVGGAQDWNWTWAIVIGGASASATALEFSVDNGDNWYPAPGVNDVAVTINAGATKTAVLPKGCQVRVQGAGTVVLVPGAAGVNVYDQV